MYGGDNESGGLLDSASAFSEASIRRGFMRKVYSILSLQLLVTAAIAGIFFIEPVRLYAQQNSWMIFLGFIPVIVCTCLFACCENVRRTSPGNFICLGIFTLGTFINHVDTILRLNFDFSTNFGHFLISFKHFKSYFRSLKDHFLAFEAFQIQCYKFR